MGNIEQDRALQTPAEANRDKHMNYRAAEDGDINATGNNEGVEESGSKYDADSGNDSTNEILQKEKLIDPGNEHTDRSGGNKANSPKYDADSGGDGTGTMGSKPE